MRQNGEVEMILLQKQIDFQIGGVIENIVPDLLLTIPVKQGAMPDIMRDNDHAFFCRKPLEEPGVNGDICAIRTGCRHGRIGGETRREMKRHAPAERMLHQKFFSCIAEKLADDFRSFRIGRFVITNCHFFPFGIWCAIRHTEDASAAVSDRRSFSGCS